MEELERLNLYYKYCNHSKKKEKLKKRIVEQSLNLIAERVNESVLSISEDLKAVKGTVESPVLGIDYGSGVDETITLTIQLPDKKDKPSFFKRIMNRFKRKEPLQKELEDVPQEIKVEFDGGPRITDLEFFPREMEVVTSDGKIRS